MDALLEQAVAQRFAEAERAAVMVLLAQNGEGPYEREVDRVRRVIVQMSNGSLPRLARSSGFSSREVRRIREIIFEHRPRILEAWNEHCRRAQYQTQDCISCRD